MSDLIYNRLATVYRDVRVTDTVNGARMVATPIITSLACSIQVARDRNVGSTALPAGVQTSIRDPVPGWKLFCKHSAIRMLKGDTVVDDIGRKFLVGAAYETPMDDLLFLNSVTP